MKEEKGNLFDYLLDSKTDAICITTNSNYSEDGIACMSGGIAGEAAFRWNQIPKNLGYCLKISNMNIPFIIGAIDNNGNYIEPNKNLILEKRYKCLIFSFPTMNDMWDGSDLDLIKNSAFHMIDYANKYNLKQIVSVRFGSGIGGLDWFSQVKPIVEKILDDRFMIVSFTKEI